MLFGTDFLDRSKEGIPVREGVKTDSESEPENQRKQPGQRCSRVDGFDDQYPRRRERGRGEQNPAPLDFEFVASGRKSDATAVLRGDVLDTLSNVSS